MAMRLAMLCLTELLSRQEQARLGFGAMIRHWRVRCGWTQYTVCNWAKEAGFEAISYGNLSVIEQGKAGELRQKSFFQLQELNRRIAQKDYGRIVTAELRERVCCGIPLGDQDVPVWGALEFWACYAGLRDVPAAFQMAPMPKVGQRKAAELSARWRASLRRGIEDRQLDPMGALSSALGAAPEPHRRRLSEVLLGVANYRPEELQALWLEDELYQPDRWLAEAWQAA